MRNPIALLLCLFCSAVVFLILGLNYFSLYQLLPIVVFYVFQLAVFSKAKGTALQICYILAILILLIFPMLAQLSWHFDINRLASKSSTSGLLFVWLPIYALIPGIIPCLVALVIKSKSRK